MEGRLDLLELSEPYMLFSLPTRLWLTCAWGFLCAWGILCPSGAHAFILRNSNFEPWSTTAAGSSGGNGRPVTLTWSLVGDGTSTQNLISADPPVGSNLISFLDSTLGGTPSAALVDDLTARPWFGLFQQTVDRWEALSGIDYTYESNDDNVALGGLSGQLGVRGDIRIGGRNIDGASSTLAFNYFPDDGDMVLDTSEVSFFGNANNNFRRFRNTLAHELGHGLNLEHVVSSTDALLLEPSIGVSFDGPQLDEVRAAHYFYGDVHEKSSNRLGNDIAARATSLGTITTGSTASIGADANVPSQLISATATDFVSVSNMNDTDFFSFSITEPGSLAALLTPLGGTFTQSAEGGTPTSFDATAQSDLALTIFGVNGTTSLATIDNTGQGASESLQDLNLLAPGEYFARVTGADDTIQLYQLDLSINAVVVLEADFNADLSVDNVDLATFQSAFGNSSAGDADGDGDTDGNDFLVWQRQFNGGVGGIAGPQAVPEPAASVLWLLAMATVSRQIRKK